MAGRIPDEILETIRERVSIVEIVSAHVSLKKAGRGYSGLCPFHSEKTPSFTVSDDRGLYHCFGCGEGGTVFTFVMKMDGLDFPSAVETLAQRANVRLPEAGAAPRRDDRRQLLQLNDAAQRRYVSALQSSQGAEARKYLEARGLSDEIIERYGIGFCPANGSAFVQAIQAKPKAVEAAIGIGLVGRRSDGRLFDRQWGRVTFPIRDGAGQIVGFGGRSLGEQQPKYLNSPESPLFHKGSVLYGFYEARTAIRERDQVVIVEGYMDVITLAQFGFANVVANLGTALTESQLRKTRNQVVVFFDGDRAGQAAAMRVFEISAKAGIWANGAFLPDKEDPDSFVRNHGVAATRALLDAAVPLAEFFLARIDPGPRATMAEREAAARRVGEALAQVEDAVRFTLLARQAAERLDVNESVFREMRAAAARRPKLPRDSERTIEIDAGASAVAEQQLGLEEKTLLEAMALDRGACNLVADSGAIESLLGPAAAPLARMILDAWEDEGSVAGLIDKLPQEIGARVAAGLLGQGPLADADKVRIARDCIAGLERRDRQSRSRTIRSRLKRAENEGDEHAVRAELTESNEVLGVGRPPRG